MLKIKDLPENILDEMYINYDELYDIYRNYNSRRNKVDL